MISAKLQALLVAAGLLTSLGTVSVVAQENEHSAAAMKTSGEDVSNMSAQANSDMIDTARSRSWTAPASLSDGGQGEEATGGLDAQGAAVAVWVERTLTSDAVWSRSRPHLGTFGRRTIVSRSLGSNFIFPQMKVSAAGFATAIWSDYDGLWTADRPPNGSWSAAELLVPGLSGGQTLVMNRRGDEAIFWSTGGARAPSSTLEVMRRLAGQPWGVQQTPVTGIHLSTNGGALSGNGDLVLEWESYDAVCVHRGCKLSNVVLHVSRQDRTESSWNDSGALAGPDPAGHMPFIAIDSRGTVGLLFTNAAKQLVSIIQAGVGGPWSGQSSVSSIPGVYVAGFTTDASGHAIVVLFGTQVLSISGQLANNTWSLPAIISGKDLAIGQVMVAEGPNGAAVAVWAAGTDYSNNTIRAATRCGPTAKWIAPLTLSPSGVQLASPQSVDVNEKGEALVLLSAFDGLFSNQTEYSTSYRP